VAKFDWGQRAVTVTARVSKAVIESYYSKAPSKSYFNGCSTGGRMAHMEAWHYPEDFDGIISGAPAVDYTGLVATYFAWVTQANSLARRPRAGCRWHFCRASHVGRRYRARRYSRNPLTCVAMPPRRR